MDKRKEPLNRKLPEYEVIQKAASGNILAVNQILWIHNKEIHQKIKR